LTERNSTGLPNEGPLVESTYMPLVKPQSVIDKEKLEKKADEKRSAEQEKESFRVIMKYAKKETSLFCFGILFLLLGSVGDFVVPLYVGLVITALSNANYEIVGTYCLHLFLIICVSFIFIIFIGFWCMCWHESIPIQHHVRENQQKPQARLLRKRDQ
jgi:hypothetical protein